VASKGGGSAADDPNSKWKGVPGLRRSERPFQYEVRAEERLKQRGITKAEVRKVVERPDFQEPAKDRDAKVYVREVSKGRKIAVVVEVRERFVRIVSAWVRR
jgi:hypothetical protein